MTRPGEPRHQSRGTFRRDSRATSWSSRSTAQSETGLSGESCSLWWSWRGWVLGRRGRRRRALGQGCRGGLGGIRASRKWREDLPARVVREEAPDGLKTEAGGGHVRVPDPLEPAVLSIVVRVDPEDPRFRGRIL